MEDTDAITTQWDESRRDDYLRNPEVYNAYQYALQQQSPVNLPELLRRRFQRIAVPSQSNILYANQQAPADVTETVSVQVNKSALWATLGFYLLGVIPAGYLSWRCNTNHGFATPAKMLFALFAGLGSWGYLSTYLFYKSYTCDPEKSIIRKKARALAKSMSASA